MDTQKVEELKQALKPAFADLIDKAVEYCYSNRLDGIDYNYIQKTAIYSTGILGKYLICSFHALYLVGAKNNEHCVDSTFVVVDKNDYYPKDSVFLVTDAGHDLISVSVAFDLSKDKETALAKALREYAKHSDEIDQAFDYCYEKQMVEKLSEVSHAIDDATTKLDPFPKSRKIISKPVFKGDIYNELKNTNC